MQLISFFTHLTICYFSILLFFVIGHFLSLSFKSAHSRNLSINLFFKVFIGLLFSITLYSIVQTQGKTIMSLNLILGLLLIYGIRRFHQSHSTPTLASPLKIPSILLILLMPTLFWVSIYSLFCFFYLDAQLPVLDVIFYSRVSDGLTLFSAENFMQADNYFSKPSALPYHYLELWLNALFVKTTGINSVLSFMIVVPSVLCSIISIGLYELIKPYINSTILSIVLVILFISFSAINPWDSHAVNSYSGYSILYTPKVTVVFLFLLAAVLAFRNRYTFLVIPILMAGSIASINAAPSLMGGAGMYILFLFLRSYFTKENNPYLLYWSVCVLLTAVLTGGFYLFLGRGAAGNAPVDYHYMMQHLSTARNIMLGNYFFLFLNLYLFILPLIFFYRRILLFLKEKTTQHIAILFLCASVTGCIIHGLLFLMTDAYQFFTLTTIPGFMLLIIMMHVTLWQQSFSFKPVFIALSCVVFSISTYYTFLRFVPAYFDATSSSSCTDEGKAYQKEVLNIIAVENPERKLYFYMRRPGFFSNIYTRNPLLVPLGSFISLHENGFMGVMLNGKDIPIEDAVELNYLRNKQMVEGGTFYQYCNQQSSTLSIEQCRINFLRQHHIEYGFFEKEELIPSDLIPLVKHKVVNAANGEVFVWLKI